MCRTCQDKANARQRATYLKRKNKGGALEKAAAILQQPTTLSSLAKQLGRPTRKGREIVDELRDRGWRFKRVMVRTGPWAVAYVTQTPGTLPPLQERRRNPGLRVLRLEDVEGEGEDVGDEL